MLAGLILAGDPTDAKHATTKEYVDRLIGLDLKIIGAFNAPANSARYLPGSGYAGNISLLPPNAVRPGEYLIVEVGGLVPPAGPVGGQTFNQGDLLISDGIAWTRLAIGGQIVQASGVVVNPPVHGETNAQAALERTLDQRGGTVSGGLVFISDDPIAGATIYKKAGAGLVLRCSAGNIQPEIEGNDAQNGRPILDPQNLWQAGFLNGQLPLPFVDLNTVQPPGYRCGVYGLADGVDYPNLPDGLPVIGTEGNRWLLLYSHLASASSDIIQILYDVCRPTPRIWSRYKVDGTVNWSAWAEIGGAGDISHVNPPFTVGADNLGAIRLNTFSSLGLIEFLTTNGQRVGWIGARDPIRISFIREANWIWRCDPPFEIWNRTSAGSADLIFGTSGTPTNYRFRYDGTSRELSLASVVVTEDPETKEVIEQAAGDVFWITPDDQVLHFEKVPTVSSDPVSPDELARKAYVDAVSSGPVAGDWITLQPAAGYNNSNLRAKWIISPTGFVMLAGWAGRGTGNVTSGDAVFSLPAGYWPSGDRYFSVPVIGTGNVYNSAILHINNSGQVWIRNVPSGINNNSQEVRVDGVSFAISVALAEGEEEEEPGHVDL
jgi:hypothetical protein